MRMVISSPAFSSAAWQTWFATLPGQPQGVTVDSRKVVPGMVFAALPGAHHDGRHFIGDAIQRGAIGILWEHRDGVWVHGNAVAQWGIDDLARWLGVIAADIYGQPSQHLRLIGVTGTNGKTSCAHWLARALSAHGTPTAVIGTLGNGMLSSGVDALTPTLNTTPDATQLQESMLQFHRQGAEAVVMEVSSIGLDTGRVNGCQFHTALFTNLSRDHLDYHGTLDAYAAAKTRLFAWQDLKHAVINDEDPLAKRLADAALAQGATVWRYGQRRDADIVAENIEHSATGMRFDVHTPQGSGEVRSPLLGDFNRMNLLGVLGVLLAQEVPFDAALHLLSALTPPPGRLQRLGGKGQPTVVIDYAHTPDALDNVLQTLRATQRSGQRLFCVFGCGGDRDPGKRPQMGKIVGQRADSAWVTNDNPRSESPQAILAAIEEGLREVNGAVWVVEADRALAIAQAVAAASAGDLVLIAGKGHEPYQEIEGVRHPFLDAEEATHALQTWSSR